MNADGTGQRRLARKRAGLRWSPDGRKIAFIEQTARATRDVYLMNADGSGVRNLTRSEADEQTVTWSPDGRKIAFVRSLDGGNSSGIYVMNADGTAQRRLQRATRAGLSGRPRRSKEEP